MRRIRVFCCLASRLVHQHPWRLSTFTGQILKTGPMPSLAKGLTDLAVRNLNDRTSYTPQQTGWGCTSGAWEITVYVIPIAGRLAPHCSVGSISRYLPADARLKAADIWLAVGLLCR